MLTQDQDTQPQPRKANEFCPYDADTEIAMKRFYHSLSEKDKRRYAGIEALKLEHGGQKYIAKLLGCSRGTVKKGACEVSDLTSQQIDKRIRQTGGGRKKYSEKWLNIDKQFLSVLQEHTAGDPMDEQIVWTDLNHKEIQHLLGETYGVWVSKPIIKK